MWPAYEMTVVALGHVAAAFKHQWLDEHDFFRRMNFGGWPMKRIKGFLFWLGSVITLAFAGVFVIAAYLRFF